MLTGDKETGFRDQLPFWLFQQFTHKVENSLFVLWFSNILRYREDSQRTLQNTQKCKYGNTNICAAIFD